MREILFRGQTRRKGEKVRMGDGKPLESNWVYGGIFPNNNGGDFAVIYSQYPDIEKYPVYADTVGEYSGFTDREGTRIFEDDIVSIPNSEDIGVVKFGLYDNKHFGFYIEWIGACHLYRKDIHYWASLIKVVGNIYDNPEMLKKSEVEVQ